MRYIRIYCNYYTALPLNFASWNYTIYLCAKLFETKFLSQKNWIFNKVLRANILVIKVQRSIYDPLKLGIGGLRLL